MRLQLRDLHTHLNQRGLAPLYFIFGEEPLQYKEALEAILGKAKEQGFSEKECFDINAHFNWDSLSQNLKNRGLFSDKRLIECRLQEGKINKAIGEALIKIASLLPPETLLLICANKIDSASQKTAWFNALERLSVTLYIKPLSKAETLAWLEKRLVLAGFKTSPDILEELFLRTEGNLLAAASAIEQLKLSFLSSESSPTFLSPLEIKEHVALDARFSLFDLVDTLLEGSITRTIRILHSLNSEGVEPILVLWALTREVRIILKVAYAVQAGSQLSEAFREFKIWSQKATLIFSFLQKCQITALLQFLTSAKMVDEIIKGRLKGDAWFAIEQLCLNLMGLSKHE